MEYVLTELDNNKICVTVTEGDTMVGILHFEKAKLNFTNKPLSMGSWACVDAKIENGDIFNEEFTPKIMVGVCQDLIREAGF